jgi:recombining binding protein (suppressor of hairless)
VGALQRFSTLAQGHCVVIVCLPDLQDIIKAVNEDLPKATLSETNVEDVPLSNGDNGFGEPPEQLALPPPVVGQSLPLLFIRPCDGVGYHSGRSIAVENLFAQIHLHNGGPPVDAAWLRAAQEAMGGEMGSWTVRVL